MSDQLNKSPLKWAGGKSKLIPLLRQILPDGKRLIEPFVGGGSVFINMAYPEYVLADANRDLIEFYGVLSSAGDRETWGMLDMFVSHLNTQENFLRLRSEFNQKSGADPFRLAALFLYLNRHCFNGLCRYNSKGEFNVSFGKYDQPYAPVKELFHMRNCLRIGNATICCASYEDTLQLVEAGDVVYCDPPYVPISATANFTGYTGDGFSLDDQRLLASEAERLRRLGATVVISNADTEFTRHIYQYADHIAEVSVQRNISCDGSNRRKAKELIAVYGKSCL